MVLKMTSAPEQSVQPQNNFIEMLLIMPSAEITQKGLVPQKKIAAKALVKNILK